jgi:UDP:flavonoid glycosyltransferase YjiC (YdhE family)
MSNVVIMTIGTQGDVAPFVGLGAGLGALGHDVLIAANDSAGGMVTAAGLPFRGLPGPDLSAVAASSVGEAAARPGLRGTRSLLKTAAAAMREPIPAMIEAASGQAAILCTPSTVLLAAPIAEAHHIPCAILALQPTTPTREFSSIALGGRNLGRFANKASASLLGRVGVRMFASTVRGLRQDLGLNARPGKGWAPAELPVLYGISTAVLTRPRDYPPAVDFAGYWWPRSMSEWTPSTELLRFLEDGPTPIYIGFGSAGASRGNELSAIISEALERSGHRAIVQRGWTGLTISAPKVIVVEEIPHEWLFPKVAAVVHHCGAGTTATGLRYGRPAVPVPFAQDQPFWAHRLLALGAAPAVLPAKRLRADRLADALTTATTDSSFAEHAADVGARLANDDSVAAAARLIRRLIDEDATAADLTP